MEKTETRNYIKFCDDMILRDFLALDRTILANKRTMLAYVRTFIGLVAGGIGLVKLVSDGIVNIVGYVFIAMSFPILVAGIIEFIKMERKLTEIQKEDWNKLGIFYKSYKNRRK